eukprot:gene9981-12233_t
MTDSLVMNSYNLSPQYGSEKIAYNDMQQFSMDDDLSDNEYNDLSPKDDNPSPSKKRGRGPIQNGIRRSPNKWTKEENQKLFHLVTIYGEKKWKRISAEMGGQKTGAQCAQHWKRVLSPDIRKGPWDEDEEELLLRLVNQHGSSWKKIAKRICKRTDIQCRYQYLKALQSREVQWITKEDEVLIKKVQELSDNLSWLEVSEYLAKLKHTNTLRTALECKTRYLQLTNGNGLNGINISNNNKNQSISSSPLGMDSSSSSPTFESAINDDSPSSTSSNNHHNNSHHKVTISNLTKDGPQIKKVRSNGEFYYQPSPINISNNTASKLSPLSVSSFNSDSSDDDTIFSPTNNKSNFTNNFNNNNRPLTSISCNSSKNIECKSFSLPSAYSSNNTSPISSPFSSPSHSPPIHKLKSSSFDFLDSLATIASSQIAN